MGRRGCWAAVAAVLIGLAASWTESIADDDKEPSIKEIMTKADKGGNSLFQPRWAKTSEVRRAELGQCAKENQETGQARHVPGQERSPQGRQGIVGETDEVLPGHGQTTGRGRPGEGEKQGRHRSFQANEDVRCLSQGSQRLVDDEDREKESARGMEAPRWKPSCSRTSRLRQKR